MDEINSRETSKEPKNNSVLFFVIGVLLLLIIVTGAYFGWNSYIKSQKQNSENEKVSMENRAENQSVLNIFGQIEKIEGKNITIKDNIKNQVMTFTWTDNLTVSKENLNSEGFSKVSFSDLKKGQSVNVMYQNNNQKTPLSMVLMGGTNIVGEVIEMTDGQIKIKNQQDTFLIKLVNKTNITRLGQNDKMENNLPVNEIKKGDFVAVTAQDALSDGDNTVEADKIEILPQEK